MIIVSWSCSFRLTRSLSKHHSFNKGEGLVLDFSVGRCVLSQFIQDHFGAGSAQVLSCLNIWFV